MPIGYVEALKGDTDSTKSGRGGVVVEACKLTTASRSERPRNDVGMREQQLALPGGYHKWKWRYVPTRMPAAYFLGHSRKRG